MIFKLANHAADSCTRVLQVGAGVALAVGLAAGDVDGRIAVEHEASPVTGAALAHDRLGGEDDGQHGGAVGDDLRVAHHHQRALVGLGTVDEGPRLDGQGGGHRSAVDRVAAHVDRRLVEVVRVVVGPHRVGGDVAGHRYDVVNMGVHGVATCEHRGAAGVAYLEHELVHARRVGRTVTVSAGRTVELEVVERRCPHRERRAGAAKHVPDLTGRKDLAVGDVVASTVRAVFPIQVEAHRHRVAVGVEGQAQGRRIAALVHVVVGLEEHRRAVAGFGRQRHPLRGLCQVRRRRDAQAREPGEIAAQGSLVGPLQTTRGGRAADEQAHDGQGHYTSHGTHLLGLVANRRTLRARKLTRRSGSPHGVFPR